MTEQEEGLFQATTSDVQAGCDHPGSEHCRACGADFDGGPIPESIRQHYSPPYRWDRKIGMSDGDRIYAWKCPDCRETWSAHISQPAY